MALFPINLQVEESALGTVLRFLKGLPGIAKMDLMLDDVAGPKGGPRKQQRSNGDDHPDRPPIKTLIITALLNGPLHLDQLFKIGIENGFQEGSVSTALGALRKAGITESGGLAIHKLTAEALEKMKAAPAEEKPLALPKPDGKREAGAEVVLERLMQGGASRHELVDVLIKNHLAASSINTLLHTMQERKQIERTEAGIYQIKSAEPPPKKKIVRAAPGQTQKAVLAILLNEAPLHRSEIMSRGSLTRKAVDAALHKLKEDGLVKPLGAGKHAPTLKATKEQ